MDLSNLQPALGSKHSDNFRRGRGHGSGNGKTAGKGHKGQKARSGATRPGFEGGQMPLYRRIPKRGFTNRNSKDIVAVNISVLDRLAKTAREYFVLSHPSDFDPHAIDAELLSTKAYAGSRITIFRPHEA